MATVLGPDEPDAIAAADARVVLERLHVQPFLERLDSTLAQDERPVAVARD